MRNRRRKAVALGRHQIVMTAMEKGISEAARQHACARSTVQRLVDRFQAEGLWGLYNQPRGRRYPSPCAS